MNTEQKNEITKISKGFADGMLEGAPIDGTSWMVVDPLAGYLSCLGYENTLSQIPHPVDGTPVLIIEFKDGAKFMPTGKDLQTLHQDFDNYQWL
jgi:hypothetical protein